MKKLFFVLGVSVLFFSACQKTEVRPASVSSSTQDDATVVKTRSAILTSHQWMYKGFYFHYVSKQQKGDPEYIRGANNNAINLDETRFTFRSNGTFVELDGGYRYPGTWEFTDNTATVMNMHYSWGTDECTFTVFSSNRISFTQPMGYNSLSFTELIPAQ